MSTAALIDASVAPCSLHRRHAPRNETVEFHHVVPVAWQLHTQVTAPPFPGVDPDGRGKLWDDRGVMICPTGHRNVHYWIVRMMHIVAAGAGAPTPAQAFAALPATARQRPEAQTAVLALERYAPFGSLLALTKTGQWGQV